MSVQMVTTADGRTLAYEQIGDPAGTPILMLHGTPGCRLSGRHPEPSRVGAAGLRLITYDRPGYGRSSRHPGRSVVDCVDDVAAIADALGVERFAVRGGSGRAPHALAVGARLPDRVTRVACEVAPAPYDAPGLDDDLAVINSWGFDVGELRVPVDIRCGAKDVLVSPAHSEWLAAHIPHATLTIDEHRGHLSTPDERLDRLRALAAS